MHMSPEHLGKYQESIMALMGTLGLGRDYGKELGDARTLSRKFASPYTIDIIEIP
jgi:hypothetical protein